MGVGETRMRVHKQKKLCGVRVKLCSNQFFLNLNFKRDYVSELLLYIFRAHGTYKQVYHLHIARTCLYIFVLPEDGCA
jgi:hypothetical protein